MSAQYTSHEPYFEGSWIHIFEAEIEDGDHLRTDEQEFDPESEPISHCVPEDYKYEYLRMDDNY